MKTTNPQEYKELISLLIFGLNNQLFTKQEIINWADDIIMEDDEPDIFFIDLALSRSKSVKDIIGHLNNFLDYKDIPFSPRAVFAKLYVLLSRNHDKLYVVIHIVFQYVHDDPRRLTDTEISTIYGLESDSDLVIDNKTFIQVLNYAIQFLSTYSEYTIGNYKQWQQLDHDIEKRI